MATRDRPAACLAAVGQGLVYAPRSAPKCWGLRPAPPRTLEGQANSRPAGKAS